MMLKRKYLIIAIIVPVLFGNLIYSILAQTQPDPWCDFDEDMDIDIDDVRHFCESYIAYWTIGSLPINRTGLLLELQDRVDSLNTSLLDLEAYLETRINTLEASLVEVEARVSELEARSLGFMNPPAWDSGWINISQGDDIYITHNLNTTDLLVYVIGRLSTGVHQFFYGADKFYSDGIKKRRGLNWGCVTNTQIRLSRFEDDDSWEQVRVMIWIIQEPPT